MADAPTTAVRAALEVTDPSATVAWNTVEALLAGTDDEAASVHPLVWPSADGSLLAWEDVLGPRCVLTLQADPAVLTARIEALSVVEHPSLARWLEVREAGDGVAVMAERLPVPPTHGGPLRADDATRWAAQLAQVVVTLEQAGLSHGGMAEAFVGPSGSRVRCGPPRLLHPGDPAGDRAALGPRFVQWGQQADVPELEALGRSLQEDGISGLELLLRTTALADRWSSADGRYHRTAELGRGGMGVVHRATDTALERPVALKTAQGHDPRTLGAFLDEARLTARLQHPGVVPVYEVGSLADGRPFYTMEEVRGDRLDTVIATRPRRELLEIVARVCDTLAYVHHEGVVHRDLKPSNIQVGAFGEVRVLDWGLGVRVGEPVSRPAGTPGYAAPEQLQPGAVDARCDVYAVGKILAEVLGDPAPEELQALVEACTAADPHGRPAHGGEVAVEIRAWLAGQARHDRADRALEAAQPHQTQASAAHAEAAALRARADTHLAQIDSWAPIDDHRSAWALQDQAEQREADAAVLEARYEQGLRAALDHDPEHRGALDRVAELYRERIQRAESTGARADAIRWETLLSDHDGGRHRAWLTGDGAVSLVTDPPGAEVWLHPLIERDRRRVPGVPERLGTTPLDRVTVPRGSWLLVLRHPACDEVRYPVFLDRGDHWDGRAPSGEVVPIWLPPRGTLNPDVCYVPAGWFQSGGDPEAVDGISHRRLWADGFMIRRRPLTVRQARTAGMDVQGEPDVPVTQLTWTDATDLAARLGPGWRLPHDQEWEKAARGVDGRWYPFGDHLVGAMAHHVRSQSGTPTALSTDAFPLDVSIYGVRGMAGGVRDWCHNHYLRHGPPPGVRINPYDEGPASPYRFLRGGSFLSVGSQSRCAMRLALPPDRGLRNLGVRPVRSVQPHGPATLTSVATGPSTSST